MDMNNLSNFEKSFRKLIVVGRVVFQFCKKHWFNAFVLFFLIHLLLFKKVNIQVSLESIAHTDGVEEEMPATTVHQSREYLLPRK